MFSLENLIKVFFGLEKDEPKCEKVVIKETPKEENRKKINERNIERYLYELENILVSLNIDKENVMLTGSIALFKQNIMPDDRLIHDVDVVVKGDATVDRDLQTLVKIYGGTESWKEKEYYNQLGAKHKPFIFTRNEVVFNFWVIDDTMDFDTELKSKEGYYVATLKHVLDAKKSYGRQKDLKDILSIVNLILN